MSTAAEPTNSVGDDESVVPISKTVSISPADWEILDMRDGKVFFSGPDSAVAKNLTAENIGQCEPIDDIAEALQSVNLVADSRFSTKNIHWQASSRQAEGIAIRTVAAQPDHLAPSAGRAIDIAGKLRKSDGETRIFLVYFDPVWGKNIPVRPGEKCQFAASVTGDSGTLRIAIEFFDHAGNLIAYEGHDTETQAATGAQKDVKRLSVQAVAPQRAVHMVFLIRFSTTPKKTGSNGFSLALAEPIIKRGARFSSHWWHPEPRDLEPYRRLIGDSDRRVYCATLPDRESYLPANRIALWSDDLEKPLLECEFPHQQNDAVLQVFSIDGATIKVKVRHFSGLISLRVDGETVGVKPVHSLDSFRTYLFTVPPEFLDGQIHAINLADEATDRVLARDFSVIADHTTNWSTIETYCMPPFEKRISSRAYEWTRSFDSQLEYFARRDELDTQDRWLMRHLPRIRDVIVRGFENNSDIFPLVFRKPAQPTVSVIIPVHNKYRVTFHCLCSLLLARNDANFEIIIVDDGSSDETAERLAEHDGITVVSRKSAGGFVDACNEGAAHARGEYLLFLNNDVETTAHWMDELLKVFDIFPETGATASQLLFPDGRLQDAGGLVWKTGTPANYGRGQNALDPRFTYSRDADYLTGAALMTPVDIWKKIGGFAEELKPAYFEDTWYSFAVRELGLRTIYCALSKVYHVQGVSNGVDTETTTGLKRFQKINHPKFKRRWSRAYAVHGDEWVDTDLQKDRKALGRVLVISWTLARPDNDAGSFALVQEMKLLQRLGMKVTHMPANCAYLGRYNLDLRRQGIECIHAPFASSVEDFLIQRGSEFDLVYVCNYTTMGPLVEPIRKYAPQATLALNVVDLHFLREMRKSLLTGDVENEERAHLIREDELNVIRQSDIALSYSGFETEMIRALVGSKTQVKALPWVQPISPCDTTFGDRTGLCFIGSNGHPPNPEAVDHFARFILPKIDGAGSETNLHVYGSRWTADAQSDYPDGITIEGFIPELGDAFARHRVFVAPLRSGAGVKGKVISAMAHGIPTILSPVAAESLPVNHMEDCLIAESDQEWVQAIGLLRDDKALWDKLRENGLKFVERHHSFDKGAETMRDILRSVEIYV